MMFIAITIAFFGTLFFILLLKPLARKVGLMDRPGGRKTHAHETPLIGGLGIYLGLVLGCLFSPEVVYHYTPLLTISCLLLLTGMVDDYYPLPALVRMGFQIVAAWLMCTWGGNELQTLGRLVNESELYLGRFITVMTIFATVGVINAVNMIDGMDGLCGGMMLLCLAFLAVCTGINGNHTALLGILGISMACMLAFLFLNFRAPVKMPALIYLGDSGSAMLGLIIAWLLIEGSQGYTDRVIPATVALWFLAVPLMDTVYLFIARPLSGKSPFASGTDHLHHVLVGIGFSKSQAVMLMYCLAIIFGLVGMLFFIRPKYESWSLYVFLLVFIIYSVLKRKMYKPMDSHHPTSS